jgi:hypothetical protein
MAQVTDLEILAGAFTSTRSAFAVTGGTGIYAGSPAGPAPSIPDRGPSDRTFYPIHPGQG